MLAIQCTKKLKDELKIYIPKEISVTLDLFYSWHSHLFMLNRRKCVIVMNNLTTYNFIMMGLRKDNFKAYDQTVVAAIKENLLAEGASKEQVDKYMKNCDLAAYLPTSDRSIISQMNEMIRVVEHWNSMNKYEGVEANIDEINRKLNRFVMLKLPKSYSGKTMLEELNKIIVE